VTRPQIKWISPGDPPDAFPAITQALRSPNGLLAAGGDLSAERLLHAYEHGIFPWFDNGQPILWWSPDPRCVLLPADLHLSRRFRRSLKNASFGVSFNEAFGNVIIACSGKRDRHTGTWITPEMIDAYGRLHTLGWAHSVEVWLEGELVGGIYGIAIGRAFFGESMFSDVTNASKVAVLALCRQLIAHDFAILDCQVPSPHLMSLGATHMPRMEFASLLKAACTPPSRFDAWPRTRIDAGLLRPE
jgi:leucyl/phenylalanyl-tRNA--protein transferase